MRLTNIAHATIEAYLNEKEYRVDELTKKRYNQKGATFVTLYKNGELRGCVGTLPFDSSEELWRNVQKNAINAAFHDSRFLSLRKEEFEEIDIEVSILSEPKKLEDKNSKFLLEQIEKDMGIILKNGNHSATFLPQVWEQIPNKDEFLEQLSLKAGLDKDGWKSSELWRYTIRLEK